ncbi:MAG TPA: Gfo/Idh/MocA family oxidoreductase [Vicinamibacterales bacterium]|nr:Gfo/Idh/MocA family oxidoreductase [Vicinamibacterales bacterium]
MTARSRREFLQTSLAGSIGMLAPAIVPRTYLAGARTPPSRRITVAQIGCGRMGLEDMRGTMRHDLARVVAVCDLDTKRLEAARGEVERFYMGKGESRVEVQAYRDYREVLARPDIDAVIVTPPDHWHALVAVEAAIAGKDLYVQKPLTYDIAEAMALRKAVRARKRVLQTGSQQRSSNPWNTFRAASEAVRNGRIGKVRMVRIGIGQDQPKGKAAAAEPVPPNLDYGTWLGPAPQQPYMEDRAHPQADYGRPGWITTEDFGLGMITNWGAHHVDIAHWGMGLELDGPTTIDARATFMKDDVWTVHHAYHVDMVYPNGALLVMDETFPNGVRWEGDDGWVFCARGAAQVTASDPGARQPGRRALEASDESILRDPFGPNDKRWPASEDHYLNWLQAVVAREDPVAPVDQAARSLQACAAAWIGMKLGRRLTWDAANERFTGDAEANALCARTPRSPQYDLAGVMKQAGIA